MLRAGMSTIEVHFLGPRDPCGWRLSREDDLHPIEARVNTNHFTDGGS